jgi:hypothetical protein
MSLISYTKDDLMIRIPVTFDPESGVTSLEGGTVEAFAAPVRGGAAIAGSSVAITAPDLIQVVWNDLALPVGVYELQVRATVAGQTRTLVAEQLTVRRSVG